MWYNYSDTDVWHIYRKEGGPLSKYTFDSFYRFVQKVGFVKANEFVKENPEYQEALAKVKELLGTQQYA